MEEEWNPGGGEEFGVGGALVGGEEHVGVHHVESGGEQGGSGCGEVVREAVQCEAAGGEGQPGVEDRRPRPGEGEAEDGSDGPGEGRVEDEAWFAGVPGGRVGPVRMQVAVGELAGCLEPVEDVEVEVVAAGAAVEDERKDGDERGERKKDVGKSVALHGYEGIAVWLAPGSTFWISLDARDAAGRSGAEDHVARMYVDGRLMRLRRKKK